MKIMIVIAVTVRLLALLAASWPLMGLATPTADPFVVTLAWLVVITVALSIPAGRRALSAWVRTGRLGRTSV